MLKKALLAALILLTVSAAWAAPPNVQNGTFDAQAIMDNTGSTTITNWTVDVATCQVFNPPAADVTPNSGNNVAFCRESGAMISQDVGGMVEEGGNYTLEVFTGLLRNFNPAPDYVLTLRGSTSGMVCETATFEGSALGTVMNSVSISIDGGSADCTITPNPCCGEGLTIELSGGALNGASTPQQISFDSVTLTPVELQSFSID